MDENQRPSPVKQRTSMIGSAFAVVKNYFTPDRATNLRTNESLGITPLVRNFASLTLDDSSHDSTDSFRTTFSQQDDSFKSTASNIESSSGNGACTTELKINQTVVLENSLLESTLNSSFGINQTVNADNFVNISNSADVPHANEATDSYASSPLGKVEDFICLVSPPSQSIENPKTAEDYGKEVDFILESVNEDGTIFNISHYSNNKVPSECKQSSKLNKLNGLENESLLYQTEENELKDTFITECEVLNDNAVFDIEDKPIVSETKLNETTDNCRSFSSKLPEIVVTEISNAIDESIYIQSIVADTLDSSKSSIDSIVIVEPSYETDVTISSVCKSTEINLAEGSSIFQSGVDVTINYKNDDIKHAFQKFEIVDLTIDDDALVTVSTSPAAVLPSCKINANEENLNASVQVKEESTYAIASELKTTLADSVQDTNLTVDVREVTCNSSTGASAPDKSLADLPTQNLNVPVNVSKGNCNTSPDASKHDTPLADLTRVDVGVKEETVPNATYASEPDTPLADNAAQDLNVTVDVHDVTCTASAGASEPHTPLADLPTQYLNETVNVKIETCSSSPGASEHDTPLAGIPTEDLNITVDVIKVTCAASASASLAGIEAQDLNVTVDVNEITCAASVCVSAPDTPQADIAAKDLNGTVDVNEVTAAALAGASEPDTPLADIAAHDLNVTVDVNNVTCAVSAGASAPDTLQVDLPTQYLNETVNVKIETCSFSPGASEHDTPLAGIPTEDLNVTVDVNKVTCAASASSSLAGMEAQDLNVTVDVNEVTAAASAGASEPDTPLADIAAQDLNVTVDVNDVTCAVSAGASEPDTPLVYLAAQDLNVTVDVNEVTAAASAGASEPDTPLADIAAKDLNGTVDVNEVTAAASAGASEPDTPQADIAAQDLNVTVDVNEVTAAASACVSAPDTSLVYIAAQDLNVTVDVNEVKCAASAGASEPDTPLADIAAQDLNVTVDANEIISAAFACVSAPDTPLADIAVQDLNVTVEVNEVTAASSAGASVPDTPQADIASQDLNRTVDVNEVTAAALAGASEPDTPQADIAAQDLNVTVDLNEVTCAASAGASVPDTPQADIASQDLNVTVDVNDVTAAASAGASVPDTPQADIAAQDLNATVDVNDVTAAASAGASVPDTPQADIAAQDLNVTVDVNEVTCAASAGVSQPDTIVADVVAQNLNVTVDVNGVTSACVSATDAPQADISAQDLNVTVDVIEVTCAASAGVSQPDTPVADIVAQNLNVTVDVNGVTCTSTSASEAGTENDTFKAITCQPEAFADSLADIAAQDLNVTVKVNEITLAASPGASETGSENDTFKVCQPEAFADIASITTETESIVIDASKKSEYVTSLSDESAKNANVTIEKECRIVDEIAGAVAPLETELVNVSIPEPCEMTVKRDTALHELKEKSKSAEFKGNNETLLYSVPSGVEIEDLDNNALSQSAAGPNVFESITCAPEDLAVNNKNVESNLNVELTLIIFPDIATASEEEVIEEALIGLTDHSPTETGGAPVINEHEMPTVPVGVENNLDKDKEMGVKVLVADNSMCLPQSVIVAQTEVAAVTPVVNDVGIKELNECNNATSPTTISSLPVFVDGPSFVETGNVLPPELISVASANEKFGSDLNGTLEITAPHITSVTPLNVTIENVSGAKEISCRSPEHVSSQVTDGTKIAADPTTISPVVVDEENPINYALVAEEITSVTESKPASVEDKHIIMDKQISKEIKMTDPADLPIDKRNSSVTFINDFTTTLIPVSASPAQEDLEVEVDISTKEKNASAYNNLDDEVIPIPNEPSSGIFDVAGKPVGGQLSSVPVGTLNSVDNLKEITDIFNSSNCLANFTAHLEGNTDSLCLANAHIKSPNSQSFDNVESPTSSNKEDNIYFTSFRDISYESPPEISNVEEVEELNTLSYFHNRNALLTPISESRENSLLNDSPACSLGKKEASIKIIHGSISDISPIALCSPLAGVVVNQSDSSLTNRICSISLETEPILESTPEGTSKVFRPSTVLLSAQPLAPVKSENTKETFDTTSYPSLTKSCPHNISKSEEVYGVPFSENKVQRNDKNRESGNNLRECLTNPSVVADSSLPTLSPLANLSMNATFAKTQSDVCNATVILDDNPTCIALQTSADLNATRVLSPNLNATQTHSDKIARNMNLTQVIEDNKSTMNQTVTIEYCDSSMGTPVPQHDVTQTLGEKTIVLEQKSHTPQLNKTTTIGSNSPINIEKINVPKIVGNEFNRLSCVHQERTPLKSMENSANIISKNVTETLLEDTQHFWNGFFSSESNKNKSMFFKELNENNSENTMGAWHSLKDMCTLENSAGKPAAQDNIFGNQTFFNANDFDIFNTDVLPENDLINRKSLYVKFDPLFMQQSDNDQTIFVDALAGAKNIADVDTNTDNSLDKLKNEIARLYDLYNQREVMAKSKLSYLDLRKSEVEEECHQEAMKLKKSEERQCQLEEELKERTSNNQQLVSVSSGYEQLISCIKSELKVLESEKVDPVAVKADLDSSKQHLKSAEDAFIDVLAKYEKLRATVPDLKSNAEANIKQIHTLQRECLRIDDAMRLCESECNAQLEDMKSACKLSNENFGLESARVTAQLRKTELTLKNTQDTHDKIVVENEKLAILCDDIIEGKS